jgi:hypothetical protein
MAIVTTDGTLDLSRIGRSAAARRRTQARRCEHTWKAKRSGVERCTSCGDFYPCNRLCDHFDCNGRRMQLGLITEWPRDADGRPAGGYGLQVLDGPVILLDTTDDDELEWTLPTPASLRKVTL